MHRNERVEIKVGLFIGVGIVLMFLIVFSISDFNVLKKGYNIHLIFDYVNGITEDAPVRFAGVDSGEVRKVALFHDPASNRSRVQIDAWIIGDVKIEKDAVARINTLGLLGEQYLEISPGKMKEFLAPEATIYGKSPINISQQMEIMHEFINSASTIFKQIEKGEGTLGKLVFDDVLYEDLTSISGRLSKGEGTIGKLLVEEKIYNDLEDFVADIKAHPWKLLSKGSDRKRRTKDSDSKQKKGTEIGTR